MKWRKEGAMANKKPTVGDKYIIEIGSHFYSPTDGNKYFIKGFDSLVMTDIGLSKLERYEEQKELPHTCEFCRYKSYGQEDYPCVICDKNSVTLRDMFRE